MIQLDAVAKSYGGQRLFEALSWRVGNGDRVGLVGPNGAGKTTLCRMLAGVEAVDAGRVIRDRGTTVGFLPQEVGGVAAATSVMTEALSGFADVWELERELEAIAAALASQPSEALTARYGDVQHRFEARGGYRLEADAKVILGGLGFGPEDMHRPLVEFSGGWRMRAALARLLLLRPSLLLLDEPTNHLDLESLQWLEGFLTDYDGSIVIVSHDRYFLNRMVTSIAELGPGGLTLYHGDYETYLIEREARRELQEARARNQAKRVAEIERFVERFRYQATKARQVQSRIKMLERMERVTVDTAPRRMRFGFPSPPRTGRLVVTLANIHKAYDDNVVYAGVDLAVERGERVALVGVNGAGKSTLLKILAGVLAFEQGTRTLGANVTVHYYAQHQIDALNPTRTVLEELEAAAGPWGLSPPPDPVMRERASGRSHGPETKDGARSRLRTILGSFLFSGDSVDKKIAVLSGGEKARVALARMLVRPAALLCLDEPTNHLDLASREVLEQALVAFPGTIIFISHDRYFINRMATRVVEVAGGRLTSYLGGYDDYTERSAGARSGSTPTSASASSAKSRPQRAGSHVIGARRAQESKSRRQKRLDAVESRIRALEAKVADFTTALCEPSVYVDGSRVRAITVERTETEREIAWLMREWEELSLGLAEHD
jgi:ATP-binding cassette, subfamily F, member 3